MMIQVQWTLFYPQTLEKGHFLLTFVKGVTFSPSLTPFRWKNPHIGWHRLLVDSGFQIPIMWLFSFKTIPIKKKLRVNIS